MFNIHAYCNSTPFYRKLSAFENIVEKSSTVCDNYQVYESFLSTSPTHFHDFWDVSSFQNLYRSHFFFSINHSDSAWHLRFIVVALNF